MNESKVKAFCNECVWAWVVYDHYTTLFESGEERLKLLEEIASTFLHDISIIFKNYLLSQICKLTDPAKSCGKENLSTNYLIQHLEWPQEVQSELEEISNKLEEFRNFILPARHKILSHNDVMTLLNNTTLGAFPEGKEVEFLENLQSFVNIAYGHYFGGPFPIDATSQGDANDLIGALKKSIDYDEYFADKLEEKFQRKSRMKYKNA